MSHKLTRQELFDLIWSEPTAKLAEKFGVSDVAIAKWCKKMEIPKPPRGYWAKQQAGKTVPKQPKLKKLSKNGVDSISITQQNKTRINVAKKEPPVESVPGSLEDPHKLVKITRNGLHRGKADHRKIVHSKNKHQLDIQVSRDQIDRACLVFDSLIKTLEQEAIPVSLKEDKNSSATQVEIDGFLIEFGIEEKIQRTEKTHKSGRHYWGDDQFDYSPTGKLSIVIRSWSYGARSSWNDGKIQRIEDCIPSVVKWMKRLAVLLHEEKLRQLEWERKWEIEKQAQRKREIDEYKGKLVLDHMRMWKMANDLSSFLDELQAKAPDTPGLDEYISWARDYAHKISPVSRPEEIIFDDEKLEQGTPRSYRW